VQQLKRVASDADIRVNLEAAFQISAIEGAEEAIERPMPLRQGDFRVCRQRRTGPDDETGNAGN
jgi:hypothetical protein